VTVDLPADALLALAADNYDLSRYRKSQWVAPCMMVWDRDNSSLSSNPVTMAWSRLQ
jgi:hypothetical protein